LSTGIDGINGHLFCLKDDLSNAADRRWAMTANGKRRPPRPALELVAPGAGPEEAAAIAAALEQFLHDTAPTPAAQREHVGAWERAAIAEGVGLDSPTPWGDAVAWGR
jgi:hypothetical protein